MPDGLFGLEFRAKVVTSSPWRADQLDAALAATGLAPLGVPSLREPNELTGGHQLLLRTGGAWSFSSAPETMMEQRFVGRPQGAREHVDAVRGLVALRDPYAGGARWDTWPIPPEQRTKGPLKLVWAAPVMWFSAAYLADHNSGELLKGFTDGTLEEINGGQLLVADPVWFGDKLDCTHVVGTWLAKAQRG